MEETNLGGEANDTGFQINDVIHKIAVQTRGYKKMSWNLAANWILTILTSVSLTIITILVIVICSGVVLRTVYYLENSLLRYGILFGMAAVARGILVLTILESESMERHLFIMNMLWKKRFFPKMDERACQYHACEHKLVHLLEDRKLVTMEALQKISFIHERCGIDEFFLQEKTLALPTPGQYQETLELAEEYFRKLKEKKG